MRAVRYLPLLALLLFLVGCGGEPRLDNSSEEAFQKSMERIRGGLEAEELEKFNRAAVRVTLSSSVGLQEIANDPEAVYRRGREALDGKTAAEVIAAEAELAPFEFAAAPAWDAASAAAEEVKAAEAEKKEQIN